MGSFGGFYKGEKRKLAKERLEKLTKKVTKVWELPRVEIIKKKKP